MTETTRSRQAAKGELGPSKENPNHAEIAEWVRRVRRVLAASEIQSARIRETLRQSQRVQRDSIPILKKAGYIR